LRPATRPFIRASPVFDQPTPPLLPKRRTKKEKGKEKEKEKGVETISKRAKRAKDALKPPPKSAFAANLRELQVARSKKKSKAPPPPRRALPELPQVLVPATPSPQREEEEFNFQDIPVPGEIVFGTPQEEGSLFNFEGAEDVELEDRNVAQNKRHNKKGRPSKATFGDRNSNFSAKRASRLRSRNSQVAQHRQGTQDVSSIEF